MAILGITYNFTVTHGTKNTREDKFRVELKISSSIANGFVVDINHNELHSALPHELKNKSHFNNSEG